MKLKPISINQEKTYAKEFFEEVAKKPEGAYFEYEESTTPAGLRSIARAFERALSKKFTIRRVEIKDDSGTTQEKLAVAVTTRVLPPRRKNPKSEAAAIAEQAPVVVSIETE
jgi:hypothetical protein